MLYKTESRTDSGCEPCSQRYMIASVIMRLFCPHLWLSDCASLVQHLTANNGAKVADKRLGIEMESLRQPLEEKHDVLKWIDTSAMATDCMTKNMKPDQLLGILKHCRLDLRPTEASVKQKSQKQAQRARTTYT